MKIKRCMTCGQEVPEQLKVKGYHWEIAEGYNWGHWVKDKRKQITVFTDGGKSADVYEENC